MFTHPRGLRDLPLTNRNETTIRGLNGIQSLDAIKRLQRDTLKRTSEPNSEGMETFESGEIGNLKAQREELEKARVNVIDKIHRLKEEEERRMAAFNAEFQKMMDELQEMRRRIMVNDEEDRMIEKIEKEHNKEMQRRKIFEEELEQLKREKYTLEEVITHITNRIRELETERERRLAVEEQPLIRAANEIELSRPVKEARDKIMAEMEAELRKVEEERDRKLADYQTPNINQTIRDLTIERKQIGDQQIATIKSDIEGAAHEYESIRNRQSAEDIYNFILQLYVSEIYASAYQSFRDYLGYLGEMYGKQLQKLGIQPTQEARQMANVIGQYQSDIEQATKKFMRGIESI